MIFHVVEVGLSSEVSCNNIIRVLAAVTCGVSVARCVVSVLRLPSEDTSLCWFASGCFLVFAGLGSGGFSG